MPGARPGACRPPRWQSRAEEPAANPHSARFGGMPNFPRLRAWALLRRRPEPAAPLSRRRPRNLHRLDVALHRGMTEGIGPIASALTRLRAEGQALRASTKHRSRRPLTLGGGRRRFRPLARIEHVDRLVRIISFKKCGRWIAGKEANLPYQRVTRIAK